MAEQSVDLRIIQAAIENDGAVSRTGLMGRGLSASAIGRRVDAGLLRPVLAGFYVVTPLARPLSAARAVMLACPAAALSRSTAATRHGFAPPWFGVHLVVPHGANIRARGVTVHETRHLPDVDVIEVGGWRMTSPARTICDIAPQLLDQRLTDLIELQLTRRCPEPNDLVGCLETRRRRRVAGMDRLSRLLADLIDDEPYPESKLEIELFGGLERVGVTGIRRQYKPPWYDGTRGIVDGAEVVGKTIIEADGRRYRQVTAAHDNDRRRDRQAAAHGWLTLRVGWHELQRSPEAILDEVAEVIEQRRALARAA